MLFYDKRENITYGRDYSFCGLSRDETRIKNRFSLNSVQAEAYLSILKQQKMLMQNNGKYEITERGISFLTSCDKINGIKQKTS